MAGNGRAPNAMDQYAGRRRALHSCPERVFGSDGGDNEATASAPASPPPPYPRRSSRSHPDPSHPASNFIPEAVRMATASPETSTTADSLSRDSGPLRSFTAHDRRWGGRDSAVGSPTRGITIRPQGSFGNGGMRHDTFDDDSYDDLRRAHEAGFLDDDDNFDAYSDDGTWAAYSVRRAPAAATLVNEATAGGRRRVRLPWSNSFTDPLAEWDDNDPGYDARLARHVVRFDGAQPPLDQSASESSSRQLYRRVMSGTMKRTRDSFEGADGKDIANTLVAKGAVAVVLYNITASDPKANDIWPECRSLSKLPARYHLLHSSVQAPPETPSRRRGSKSSKKKAHSSKQNENVDEFLPDVPNGRPDWKLPVELVELIARHLNRDDIKSLRLVSRELNHYVSQVIFQTVVVPFNTEIYGMLGPEPRPDLKGKKRAKIEQSGYSWKNANGDEVYNGHGLDVFRGFGKHILKYGMSFEVNEHSLSAPPTKSLTNTKTSFWGNYDWPFDEYRRFDAVAGLETAADETPRMKIAFSELSRVKELALSIDSGLGWLNGPDRSIRARIMQRPLEVFGTSKTIPDRRAEAQQELWNHLEKCHQASGQNIKLATLYRMESQRPLSEHKESVLLSRKQPKMPYIDLRLVHEATTHDATDMQVPNSFDDPRVLDSFISTPSSSSTGVLFTSVASSTDAGQLMSPIIPANLTKAQKEWLLETEWAQRAFMSSYMLSIIDNLTTFSLVHTLNISRLSDHYLTMLDRSDFWDALPNLSNVTLMTIPTWRRVRKDEAGFVDTPKINPCHGLDPFCNLLRAQVACRPNIKNLTIGWATGGEHAEGLHARNKLISPAPVWGLGIPSDNSGGFASALLAQADPSRLRASLLHFPYLDRLTLKNCWITPPALQEFVKIHDLHSLKHLVLDSVSLTAILRPMAHANQAAQQAGALNPLAQPFAGLLGAGALWNALNINGGAQAIGLAHGQAQAQMLPNQQQFLHVYIQTYLVQLQQLQANAGGAQQQQHIAALQAQLQQQIQHLQLQNQNQNQIQQQPAFQVPALAPGQPNPNVQAPLNANFPANVAAHVQNIQHQIAGGQPLLGNVNVAAANAQTQANPQFALQAQPRTGSWTQIIDVISPGTNLSDFGSEHCQADSERTTSLQSVEFVSCGYARLPYAAFDQSAIEVGNGLTATLRNPSLSNRYSTLAPAMLSAKWAHLGEIVQEVDPQELAALDAGWNLKTGWKDAEAARAVEFDNLSRGGTGRFSGRVCVQDRVAEAASTNGDSFVSNFRRLNL